MAQLQLPAHLQGLAPTGMLDRAAEGMGSSLPPHISIQGNAFTFIDASGNEAQPMLNFDGYIADISDHMVKRYYDKPFEQNAQTYEPPACWSANGIGPSRDAPRPQAHTCEVCPQNVRGSKVSAVSGASIKACRDERWLAVINPNFGNMIFQLVITPGSFTNWKGYTKALQQYQVDPSWVLTRFSFEPRTNGVLQFTMANFTDPAALEMIKAALAEKKTDEIVGRLDRPRTAAIAGPVQGAVTIPAYTAGVISAGTGQAPLPTPPAFNQAPQQEIIPPGAPNAPFGAQASPPPAFAPVQPPGFGQAPSGNAPPAPQAPFGAQPAANAPTGMAPGFGQGAPTAPAVSPSNPAPRGRRGRPPAQNTAPQAPAAPPVAPFGQQRVEGGPAPAQAQPAAPAGNNFGIGGGAPVNPEMAQMLTNLFPNQGR